RRERTPQPRSGTGCPGWPPGKTATPGTARKAGAVPARSPRSTVTLFGSLWFLRLPSLLGQGRVDGCADGFQRPRHLLAVDEHGGHRVDTEAPANLKVCLDPVPVGAAVDGLFQRLEVQMRRHFPRQIQEEFLGGPLLALRPLALVQGFIKGPEGFRVLVVDGLGRCRRRVR